MSLEPSAIRHLQVPGRIRLDQLMAGGRGRARDNPTQRLSQRYIRIPALPQANCGLELLLISPFSSMDGIDTTSAMALFGPLLKARQRQPKHDQAEIRKAIIVELRIHILR